MGIAPKQMFDGMDVYDWDGEKIGQVARYDQTLGYFQTEGPFTGPRYIPFWAVERITPGGAYLNVSKARVKELYQHMPKIKPDLDTTGKLTGTGKVASGHTGRPTALDTDGLKLVREKITNGSKVLDADGKKVGTVQAYDQSTGYMRIEKGEISRRTSSFPLPPCRISTTRASISRSRRTAS